ncbi:MAG: DUF6212 domain-containing protein, partial [Cyanobacteria bacterium P01_F01_bin.143]
EFDYDFSLHQGKISLLGKKYHKPGKDIEMQLAPNFCLGLLGFSESGKAELEKLSNWWLDRSSAQSLHPLMELDAERDISLLKSDFWQQMYQQMYQQNSALATRITTLQQQYLALRTLHEDMQNAFAVVEDYFSQAKLPALQLAFDNQPSQGKEITPNELANLFQLQQLLPVSSQGLAIVELHIAQRDERATGYLQVQLKACEDNTCFAIWQIPYQQLPNGWLGLDLPTIDLGRKRDVELIVEWHTYLGSAPSLSLGSRQTIPEFQVSTSGGTEGYSLAYRIWTGLPGTRKVTNPYLLSVNNNSVARELISLGNLGQGAMARVQEITPNKSIEENSYVQVIDQGAKILTAPRPDGSPTIAMLPFCFPPTANQVTATVMTENSDAKMEYALVVMNQNFNPEEGLQEDLIVASSGWVAVESNIPRQISASLNGLLEEHYHIVIATRLVANSRASYAQAYWLNFNLAHNLEMSEPGLAAKAESAIAYGN